MRRPLDEVRREQEAILLAYRAERVAVRTPEARSTQALPSGEFAYGRVAEVVLAHEAWGPHLLVMRQAWFGLPPVPSDCGVGPLPCYPLPGWGVDDFQVGELIRLSMVCGAVLAEKLAG